ncbi:hypothetical protein U0070_007753 [Myodes glareolus]|uniref:Uncharacterized protein n=1 Tax=Myodes glareolus TaxID=447135 RepID=A0AAW0HZV8_MYOGA
MHLLHHGAQGIRGIWTVRLLPDCAERLGRVV